MRGLRWLRGTSNLPSIGTIGQRRQSPAVGTFDPFLAPLPLNPRTTAGSYIAGWDSKMHYNFWRPISAIRLAADDGSGARVADATWEPFLTTPPVHDYPSTHSVLVAGAVVLAHAFGRDDVTFTFESRVRAASTSASRSRTGSC